MAIFDYYRTEKENFIDRCIQCGICAEACPILPFTQLKESPAAIQDAVYDSVEHETFSPVTYTKAFACMECFKCTADICPEGLNPMLINEWIKNIYISRGMANASFSDSRRAQSPQRILASVQISAEEYQRITTPTPPTDIKTVFFPGCNVYFQPEKILNALDIMDAIGDPYAFLPGLDYCCGDNHLFFGLLEEGSTVTDNLMAGIDRYHPETVVLWCPTCHCRFNTYISQSMAVPFNVISFPQYLAAHMKKLPLEEGETPKVLTLHDPCKSTYTGVDLNGTRQVLSQLPGVELREMKHHGSDAVCCGSGAACWFPDSCSGIQEYRLTEAKETGAEQMVTVCHYCNQTFASKAAAFDLDVVSYVSLVAESMGIRREDKFKTYTEWKDLERILSDVGRKMDHSPFDKETIIETLRSMFVR